MKDNPQVTNKIADIRRERGLSASALAREIGVSRQTIYAMEAGTYVPNTLVGLRLARALAVAVEDLFSLEQSLENQPTQGEKVKLIPDAHDARVGEPMRLCYIDGTLIATPATPASPYLPDTDGSLASNSRVTLHDRNMNLDNRLLLVGCDPAMAILARHLRPLGVDIVLVHANSSRSLTLLQKGLVHVAGTHIRDASSGESNVGVVARKFKSGQVAVISLALVEEGIVTAAANPKQLKDVSDLSRRDLRFINRESGSGSRHLLESRMIKTGIKAEDIHGFESSASGHLAAASEVKAGKADCCLATHAAARMYGLGFVPLASVRYDFVIHQRFLILPPIQTMLETLTSLSFRRKLAGFGGYDAGVSGQRVM